MAGLAYSQTQTATGHLAIRIADQSGNPASEVTADSLSFQANKAAKQILQVSHFDHRQFIVILDLAFNSPEGLAASRKAAWDFLSSLDKTDVAAIAVYDSHDFIRLQCSLTSDRTQWLYALNRLEEKMQSEDAAGFHFTPDAHQKLDEQYLDDSAVQTMLEKIMGLPPKTKPENAADVFATKMTGFAKNLNVIVGEKQVILFSPGMPTRKATGDEEGLNEDRDLNMTATDSSPGEANELQQSASTREAPSAAKALAQAFSASNCVVYTVDTSRFGKPASKGLDFLKTLSKNTNGIYFDDAASLSQLKTVDPGWLVSWKAEATPSQLEQIKFSSNRNFKITAPSEILTAKPIPELNPVEKKLYFAQWIYDESTAGRLQHKEMVDFLPLENDLMETSFFLQVQGPELLETKSKMRSFYIVGYLIGANDQVVDFMFTPVRIDTTKTAQALEKSGVKYYDSFLSTAGDYRVRGAIIDVENAEANTFNLPITVPNFQNFLVTRPLIASTSQDWILLRHEYSGDKKRGIGVSYPYMAKDGIFFPDLTPSLQNGNSYFLYYSVFNLALNSSNMPAPQFKFGLQPSSGERKPISEIAIVDRSPISDNDFKLLFEFKAPAVDPGTYQLVTELVDNIAKKAVTRQVSVLVP